MKLKEILISKRDKVLKNIKRRKLIKSKKNNPVDGETPEQVVGFNTVTNGRF